MTMQGQGASQPGEGESVSLDSLAEMMGEGEDASQEEGEGEEAPESEESELDESEQEGEDEQQEDPTVTITHDGKEVSLKQSEALELAQKGFDYTKKAMAVAEERKAVESERAQASQVRQQHEAALNETADRLAAIKNYLQEQVGSPPPIEWADTHGASYYLAAKEQHDQRKGQLQQAEAAIAQLQEQRQRERQADLSQRARATVEVLRGTLPGWNEQTLPELEKYVDGYGLNIETASDGFLHKGLWELAHKAKAYDALQAEKAKLKPVNALAKVIKPGNPQPPQFAKRQEAMKRHNAAPSLNTLADLM